MRERIKKLLLPLIAAALALGCLVCLWRLHALKNLLPDQHAAERWQGEGALDFDQLSFFMARDQKLTRDQLYAFRTEMLKKLKEASLEPENNPGLLHDAWSTSDTVKVQNGRRSGGSISYFTGSTNRTPSKSKEIIISRSFSLSEVLQSPYDLDHLAGPVSVFRFDIDHFELFCFRTDPGYGVRIDVQCDAVFFRHQVVYAVHIVFLR